MLANTIATYKFNNLTLDKYAERTVKMSRLFHHVNLKHGRDILIDR